MLKINKETEEVFLAKILDLLINGKTRKTTKRRTNKKLVYGVNDYGDYFITGKEVTFTTDETIFEDGVPDKILDLVYQSLSTENSIKHLETLGYLVVDPSMVNTEDTTNQGLSESTINLIKSKILGIN